MKDTIFTRSIAASIIDKFEDLLDKHNIFVPSPENDERDIDNEAKIYGSTYYDLLDAVEAEVINACRSAQHGAGIVTDRFSTDGIARGTTKPTYRYEIHEVPISPEYASACDLIDCHFNWRYSTEDPDTFYLYATKYLESHCNEPILCLFVRAKSDAVTYNPITKMSCFADDDSWERITGGIPDMALSDEIRDFIVNHG